MTGRRSGEARTDSGLMRTLGRDRAALRGRRSAA